MPEEIGASSDAEKDLVRKLEAKVQGKDQIDRHQEQVGNSIQKTYDEYKLIEDNIATASRSLDKAFWLVDFVSWIAPVGLVVLYYAIYFYYGIPTEFALGGFEIALPTALFLRILIWTLRMRLAGEDVSFIESLKDSVRGFMGNRFKIDFQNAKFGEQLSGIWKFTGHMLNSVRSYVPGLDQYYSSQQRIREQRNFVQKLRNALAEYGFPIRGRAESYLAKDFGPLTDTEPEWVDKATKDMSIIYGVSKAILKLVYADYSNDDVERKNAWNEIIKEPKILHQFTRRILDSGRIPTEYIEKELESYGGIEELIVKTDSFNLNSFLSSYNIQYYQLVDEKDALIEAIRFYRLDISPTSEKEIKKYVPPSFKEKERLRHLFLFSATRTITQAEIIELIFYEYQGLSAERQIAWAYLKHSENPNDSELDLVNQSLVFPEAEGKSENRNLLTRFVKLLLDKTLLDIPHDYLENTTDVITYVRRILSPQQDFTLAQTRMKILQLFASIDRHKDDLLRALSSNNIPLDDEDRKIFLRLLPATNVSNPFDEEITWLADHVKVRKDILLLFYYDYTTKEKKRDDCFSDLKAGENGEVTILSQELLSRNIISTEREEDAKTDSKIANLAAYLKIAPRFERIEIESVFSQYERLFHYSKSILSYLKEQKICHEKSELSFDKLLSEITNTKTQALDQLRIITVSIVRDFSNTPFDKDWLEPIALASIIIYLVEHEDISLTNAACRRFANNTQCVKILYEYSWVNEDEQHKSQESKSPLAKVVDIAVQGSNSRVEYMAEFQRELKSHGYLPTRISDIPNVRLRHIGDQVDKVVSELEYKKKLDSHLQALGTVLESELKAKTIIESLKMQLIAAYAITFPTGADVIGAIMDDRLLDVIEDLGKENPIYNQILSRDDIKEASIGRWTRVGVVPYNMTFSDFSEHLQRAYQIAVDQYEKSGMMHHKLEDYVANVLRIFPTKTYFKQLEPFGKRRDSEDILADKLRPQILRKYGAIKTAEIMASLKTSVEEKIAMRSVLATLYDTSSALYMIAQEQFDRVLVSSPALKDYITTGKFDLDLSTAFKQPQLSELAMMIYRSAKGGGERKEVIERKFDEEVKMACSAIRARPSPSELQSVTELAFSVLFDVGMILDGLSA